MAEPASTESQGANSPARQLLAALTRASQDMEKSVNETYDYVSRLNDELEKVVSGQLDETAEQLDLFVRTQMDSVSAEKDAVLAQLTELRKEELKILQSTGKSLRLALLEKMDELVETYRKSVDEHLQNYQNELKAEEAEVAARLESALAGLSRNQPANLEAMKLEYKKEQDLLEGSVKELQERLAKETAASVNELSEHYAELKTRLLTEGEQRLVLLEKDGQEISTKQTERIALKIKDLQNLEEQNASRLATRTAADSAYVQELPNKFSESCKQMAQVQVGMHATVIRNLALQYRTELISVSQDAEDQLQIVRSDLHSQLRQYQNHYSEQFENMLSKFEKSVSELAESKASKTDEVDSELTLKNINEHFAEIKKTILENVKQSASESEASMEKSYEEFRLVLENSRKSIAEKVDASFKDNQDELSKLQQMNDAQMQELSSKLQALEQSVTEAKELIRALDQASLDF